MKSTSDKKNISTVHQSRCAVFQPTRRPVSVLAREIETGWGKAIVTGKLGQGHQDALDAAFAVAEKRVDGPDGRIYLQVDPYRLRAMLSGLPYEKIRDLFRDMRAAEVHLTVPARGIQVFGGIIDETVVSEKSISRDPARKGVIEKGNRHFWRIVVSRSWSVVMSSDAPTNYVGLLPSIVRLRFGVCQAVARLILTQHVNFQIGIDKALEVVGAGGRKRDRMDEIREEKAVLRAMGVIVDEGAGIFRRCATIFPEPATIFPEPATIFPEPATIFPEKTGFL